jgi:TonB family protein
MRKIACIGGFLVAATIGLWGQTKPVASYIVYGEVKGARLVNAVAAVAPPGALLSGETHICTIRLVVGADGAPANLSVVSAPQGPLDEAAIAAIRQSQFEPGTLRGKPVPVQAFVWVPFTDAAHPAIPVTGAITLVKGMTVPKPTNNVEAEFSDEARRRHASARVMIAMTVTDQGLPADARVAAQAGMGLDEEALKAARKYRFKPATLEGTPVPVPIVVEVNFKFAPQY